MTFLGEFNFGSCRLDCVQHHKEDKMTFLALKCWNGF